MKKAEMIVRTLLGLLMIVFGPNKFLDFIPLDPASLEVGLTMNAIMGMGVLNFQLMSLLRRQRSLKLKSI